MPEIHPTKIQLSPAEKLNLLKPYVKKKILEQVKAVALIVLYLVFFQILILAVPIVDAGIIALGIGVIVLGLAFFMEGLFLGLMPLGEVIGLKLPQKAPLVLILVFAFALGVGVTFAEPAIGVLQMAGAFIKPWDAPLLFLLLNKYSDLLKYAVGAGVGISVVLGMLRFMYSWSLKPFLFIGVPVITALSLWAWGEPNLKFLLGLAWDTGGVTTGPVTVPLVLALGIGVTRVMAKGDGEGGGFGVVTLASLLPIYTVLLLGIALLPQVPQPQTREAFFAPENIPVSASLFADQESFLRYSRENGASGSGAPAFSEDTAPSDTAAGMPAGTVQELLLRNGLSSVQAILPLALGLLLVLVVFLRERLPHKDEVFLGLGFAVLGMFLFNIGIELGLSKLGNQVGGKLPASFTRVEMTDQERQIPGLNTSLIYSALGPDGRESRFFYAEEGGVYRSVPYREDRHDLSTGTFREIPVKGPLFGKENSPLGFALVLLFAFVMGYGATMAEPALNAMGSTVENLTAGSFKKSFLMQSVAIGVGIGIAVGVMKIIWNIPLVYLIAPPYLILMVLSFFSSEEFVNIGWDSAGVTTGPITVPLVLAMGLGLSSQVGAVEGFGILATASVYPILTVLSVGLMINLRRKAKARLSEGR